jgi:hypothetical protein
MDKQTDNVTPVGWKDHPLLEGNHESPEATKARLYEEHKSNGTLGAFDREYGR